MREYIDFLPGFHVESDKASAWKAFDFLNALFDLALAAREKPLAQRTLTKLRAVNPENQRLEEFAAQLKAL